MFKQNIKTGIYLDWENFWIVKYKGVQFASYPFRELDKAQKKLMILVNEDDENVKQLI